MVTTNDFHLVKPRTKQVWKEHVCEKRCRQLLSQSYAVETINGHVSKVLIAFQYALATPNRPAKNKYHIGFDFSLRHVIDALMER